MKHKICINVSRRDGEHETVLKSGQATIRDRLLTFLFGKPNDVILITPGRTVETVEIRELPMEGGTS